MSELIPKKIILDTDLCGDCDDVGALAILLNLDRLGYCKTLAVTYCLGNPWGSDFIQHELDWFGRGDIPYGKLMDYSYVNLRAHDDRYIRPYFREFPRKERYPAPFDAVRLLRRTLTENGDVKDITLCAIGPLHNIGLLFESGPDDISDKTGPELSAGKLVLQNCPVPITFAGFEVGEHLFTGAPQEAAQPGHPVREAYRRNTALKSTLLHS